jgi:hypothetical protein
LNVMTIDLKEFLITSPHFGVLHCSIKIQNNVNKLFSNIKTIINFSVNKFSTWSVNSTFN